MKPMTSATGKPFRLIGHGIYTLAEGARLTGIPSASIRRWTQGHKYRYGKEFRFTPPAIQSVMEPIYPAIYSRAAPCSLGLNTEVLT